MLSAKKGHIVSIASVVGLGGSPQLTDYCASKFAVVGLNEALRLELDTAGNSFIRTTLVCPWVFDSGMFKGANPG